VTVLALLPAVAKALGDGLTVRRLLPSAARQAVGPFVFFDHFGPVDRQAGQTMDVRPHPHIGLATVSYLFDGAIMHRDSLGYAQRIEPGAVNWMTAGRGIVHSERTPDDLRGRPHRLHGLQLWAALPAAHEEAEPAFSHTPAADIPQWDDEGVLARVLVGEGFGLESPVPTFAPTLYVALELAPGAQAPLPAADERAIYSVDEAVTVDGVTVPPFTMAVLAKSAHSLRAPQGARVALIGGAPLDARRFVWWNFVSSRRERIEQAKADWQAQAMGRIDGDDTFIPLP
jgi:hypothetical protein